MPRTLHWCGLEDVEARQWPALTAGLLAEARPRLVCARLRGGVIALGRYQRAKTALTAPGRALEPIRRTTGGRAIALGEGAVALALALPHRSWLVSEDPSALPASRFLNRAVRGVLSGLGRLDVGAYYFGRDFVTVASSQAGHLSFDIDASGAAILECVLAVEAHWWLPSEMDGLPQRPLPPGVPAPGMVPELAGVCAADLGSAIAAGYAERFELTVEEDASPLTPAPSHLPPPELPLHSRLHAAPSGWVEAGARVSAGRIEAASLCGELLADSAGIRALESAVEGAAPTLESLGPRINAVFADPGHTILGLRDLRLLVDVLIEACRGDAP